MPSVFCFYIFVVVIVIVVVVDDDKQSHQGFPGLPVIYN